MTAIAIHASFQFLAFPIQWSTQATLQNGNIASRVIILSSIFKYFIQYCSSGYDMFSFHTCANTPPGPAARWKRAALTALLNWAA